MTEGRIHGITLQTPLLQQHCRGIITKFRVKPGKHVLQGSRIIKIQEAKLLQFTDSLISRNYITLNISKLSCVFPSFRSCLFVSQNMSNSKPSHDHHVQKNCPTISSKSEIDWNPIHFLYTIIPYLGGMSINYVDLFWASGGDKPHPNLMIWPAISPLIEIIEVIQYGVLKSELPHIIIP